MAQSEVGKNCMKSIEKCKIPLIQYILGCYMDMNLFICIDFFVFFFFFEASRCNLSIEKMKPVSRIQMQVYFFILV